MSPWLDHLVKILGIVVAAAAITLVARAVIGRIERRMAARLESGSSGQKRAHTLMGIVTTTIAVVVWATATVMILELAGIPVEPLLATAGIAGIAIGFGAQTLIKDLLSGFLILLENQYDIGDTVQFSNSTIGSPSGVVELITLRTTVLRAADGTRHVISNGEIRASSNQTRIYSRAVMVLPLPYDIDVDRVIGIANAAGAELRADPDHGADILGDVEVLGVDAFGTDHLEIKLTVETRPGRQWAVGRELRRRVKNALDEDGIPFARPAAG